jgi:hypothetical protein
MVLMEVDPWIVKVMGGLSLIILARHLSGDYHQRVVSVMSAQSRPLAPLF